MSPERAWARAAAVQRLCAGLPLTPLAPHVFGFSEPSEPTRPSRRSWRNLLNLLPISFGVGGRGGGGKRGRCHCIWDPGQAGAGLPCFS